MIKKLYSEGLVTRPLSELAEGAIKLAKEGFVMYDFLHRTITAKAEWLCKYNEAKQIFLNPECTSARVAVGEIFTQPALAETLEKYFVSVEGLESFYSGEMAGVVSQASREAMNPVTHKAGLLAPSDMAGYQAVFRSPVTFAYRAPDGELYTIHGANMPFSGRALKHHRPPSRRGFSLFYEHWCDHKAPPMINLTVLLMSVLIRVVRSPHNEAHSRSVRADRNRTKESRSRPLHGHSKRRPLSFILVYFHDNLDLRRLRGSEHVHG